MSLISLSAIWTACAAVATRALVNVHSRTCSFQATVSLPSASVNSSAFECIFLANVIRRDSSLQAAVHLLASNCFPQCHLLHRWLLSRNRVLAPAMSKTLYTIGHSTRPLQELVGMLTSNGVTTLVDVRTVPKSRTNPQARSSVNNYMHDEHREH